MKPWIYNDVSKPLTYKAIDMYLRKYRCIKMVELTAKSPPFKRVTLVVYLVVWNRVINWVADTTKKSRRRNIRNLWLILDK